MSWVTLSVTVFIHRILPLNLVEHLTISEHVGFVCNTRNLVIHICVYLVISVVTFLILYVHLCLYFSLHFFLSYHSIIVSVMVFQNQYSTWFRYLFVQLMIRIFQRSHHNHDACAHITAVRCYQATKRKPVSKEHICLTQLGSSIVYFLTVAE